MLLLACYYGVSLVLHSLRRPCLPARFRIRARDSARNGRALVQPDERAERLPGFGAAPHAVTVHA
jgi:hypothetical protein